MAAGIVPSAGLLDVAPIYAAGVPSVSASYVETDDNNPEVDTKDDVEIKVGLLDKDNQMVAPEAGGKVYVWAEKNNNVIDDALSAKAGQAGVTDDGKGVLTIDIGAAEKKLDINFSRSGKYTIHAAYIVGNGSAKPVVEGIRKAGNKNYCRQEEDAGGYGLSAAIGGCGSKQVELVNAYGTLARLGVQKDSSSIIEVKNSQGETLKKWKDEGHQVWDTQSTYIINDILSDRTPGALHGYGALAVPGVRTSAKTGTSDKGGSPKDLWVFNYSPALVMGIWLGNSDTSTITSSNSAYTMPVIRNVMAYAHTEVYAKDGKWHPGQWYNRPNGIQQIGSELYPSWWNKKQSQTTQKMAFDRVSKKKATNCTPEAAREEVEVTKEIDPITKKEVITAPSGYDTNADDDVHKCDDTKPQINSISVSASGKKYTIDINVSSGTWELAAIDITVDGRNIKSSAISSSGSQSATIEFTSAGTHTVSVTVRDSAYYTATSSKNFTSTGDQNKSSLFTKLISSASRWADVFD